MLYNQTERKNRNLKNAHFHFILILKIYFKIEKNNKVKIPISLFKIYKIIFEI